MISKPPGIEDIFPDRIDRWNYLAQTAREVFRIHNYREIIIPIMEFTEVFSRGLGDETDIVSKEMFTFEDRGGRSLTLRPEGTASVVRAYVENGEYNRLSACKLFYCGPMFRAERPQKGRLRQFNQFGAEFFGSDNPFYDYEIIALMNQISRRVDVGPFTLLINSIGCPECRKEYLVELTSYYTARQDHLCEDCRRRLTKNPLRLLDCKNASCTALKEEAPLLSRFLCAPCGEHHGAVLKYLQRDGIPFHEDPRLVRGLDYYTKTTFEFVSENIGGQNAFAAGGRYNSLVEVFGGKATPAVGFAAGMERMLLLLEQKEITVASLDVYLIHAGDRTLEKALEILSELRGLGISADIDPETKGFKSQFKKADREKARFVIIIGEDELAANAAQVKEMKTGEQEKVLLDHLKSILTVKIAAY